MSHWEPTAGASDEWYTPAYIFEALGETFDTDVAAPWATEAIFTPTDHWICADSLLVPWEGFVWMNPPFGGRDGLVPWLDKFFKHGHGIALTPDRTSAQWWRDAWRRADLALFMPKVKFVRPDGSFGKQPSNGTCLWASGARAEQALHRAATVGLGVLGLPVGTLA